MIFYSFYTGWQKNPDQLVYRTQSGQSELQVNLLMFETKQEAEKDFFRILWDNDEFRIGEYFDTEKGKKKKVEPQVKAISDQSYKTLPSDFSIELDKVYNLDCMLFMKELPNKYLDYVFTSPPYNAGKRTSHGKNNAIYENDEDMYAMYEDDLGNDEYEEWLFSIVRELLRVTKKHIFFNIQMLGNNKRTVQKLFSVFGEYLKDIIIWNKTIASPHIVPGIMNSAFEFIFIFSNDEPNKRNFKDGNFQGNFRNVITGVNSSQNKYRHLNKATFPLYLPRTLMQKFGKPKDIWYDPFSGTGTTFHAATLEDRHFLGTEIDINQCEATNKRIWMEEGTLKLQFGDGNEVYGLDYGKEGVEAVVKVEEVNGVKSFEVIEKRKVENLSFDFEVLKDEIEVKLDGIDID